MELGEDIDPYHTYTNTQHIPQEYLEMVADETPFIEDESGGDEFIYEDEFND